MSISLILLVVALVLFVVSAFNVPSRINLLATGLAFFVLAQIVGARLL